MTMKWRTALMLSGALVLGVTAGARAQERNLSGYVGLGFRGFLDQPAAQEMAKFEEYRDYSQGVFLPELRLHYEPGGLTSFDVGSQDALRRDQTFFVAAQRPGLFHLNLGFDQIAHTFSTTARGWGGSVTDFSLPTPRPDTIQWKSAPLLGAIRNTWKVGQASLTLTPGSANDLSLNVSRVSKSGERPMGMAFGSPGANQREILEPIDQTVSDVQLSESYATRRYQVQVSYDLNAFSNAIASVTADNPLLATSSATTGSATGRSALAPSNVAHTLAMAGGLSLPLRTRFTSAFTFGWRSQDEPFIPMTINAAITNPQQTVMPRSLTGDVRTTLASLGATTHPLPDVTVTARYRFYKFDDRTPEFTAAQMPLEIVNDRTASAVTDDVVEERAPYQRHNAALELGLRPSDMLNLRAGVNVERWLREAVPGPRNRGRTTETTPRVTLDVTPTDWLLLRAAYSRPQRRGSAYFEDSDRPELRRFDQADKNADRRDLLLQLTPNDKVNFGLTFGRGTEVFPTGTFGVRDDDNRILGADIGWTPLPRFNLYGSYTREVYDLDQHSRYGEPSMPDNPTYDWLASTREWVETYGVGADATLIPNQIYIEFRYDRSNGISALRSTNPFPPSGGTASQNANATAVDFPDITHSWNPVRLAIRYQLNPTWSGTVGYNYERFRNNDFRTNRNLAPYANYWGGVRSTVDPGSDITLGSDLLPYETNYITFTIGFHPNITRAAGPVARKAAP